MKVAFLTNHLHVGGIEKNLIRLCSAFTERGHEVVALTGGGALVDAFVAAGGRHVTVPLAPRLIRAPGAAAQLRRVLLHEGPDCIHVFSASAAVLARLAFPIRPPAPVVASIMGMQNNPSEPGWRTASRAWATGLGADRLVVIAPSIDELVQRLPIRRSRIVRQPVVGVTAPEPESVSAEALQRVMADLALPLGQHLVSTIGNLEPRKSHHLFVDAAVRVLHRRQDVRFAIVGEGELRGSLEQHIHQRGVGHAVTLTGERHDIDAVLAATAVYVKPGVVEGFVGITVIEAQLLSKPVIAFETEDVKLAIKDGDTGLLVPNGDVGSLARAIEVLLDDRKLAARVGQAGQKRALEQFELGSVATGLLKLYSSLATRRHGGRPD